MRLEHKSAVIDGAGGAIGGAVAREIAAAGGAAKTAPVDALDEPSVEPYSADVAKKAGSIDISFNAIGMADVQGTPRIEMALEEVSHLIIGRRGPRGGPDGLRRCRLDDWDGRPSARRPNRR